MAHAAADYSAQVGKATGNPTFIRPLFTALTATLTSFFIWMCWLFYWVMAVPAAITALVIPRRWLEQGTLVWLVAASLGVAASTQTMHTVIPDFTQPAVALGQIGVWFALGFFARVYLVYSELPDTFQGMKDSIASRRIDSWFASVLPNPIDAILD